MNDLISIVVPIYKVEKYLNRCVESLLKQTYVNTQIILVDDGSTDKCPQICDSFAKKYSNIEVIHKSNSGLGLTRNEGLKKVTGKYVCFVDSDDYINETTLEKLCNRIEETQADVCYYGCVDVLEHGERTKKIPKKLEYIGESIRSEFAAKLIGNMPYEEETLFSGFSACYAFYRVDFLRDNSIFFHSEREQYISEDLIFNLKVCSYANRLAILPESLYYYVIRRNDSLRSSYRNDRFDKCKIMYLKLLEYVDKFYMGKEGILRAQKYLIQAVIICTKMEALKEKPKKEKILKIKGYRDDKLFQKILHSYPVGQLQWKQKIFCLFAKYNFIYGMYAIAIFQNMKLKSYI